MGSKVWSQVLCNIISHVGNGERYDSKAYSEWAGELGKGAVGVDELVDPWPTMPIEELPHITYKN